MEPWRKSSGTLTYPSGKAFLKGKGGIVKDENEQ